jgi:hypothetical protein
MFRRVMTSPARILTLLAFALLLGGCGCPGPIARPVHVDLGADLRGQQFRTIEFDLVFVQENQLSLWQEKDVIDYFAGGDTLRRDESRKTTLVFEPGGEAAQSFGDDRPEIEQIGQWIREGATHLFVLAKLPDHERIGRRPGASDPRKQAIPLSGCAWEEANVDDQDIRVTVRRGSVLLSPSVPMSR